MKSGRVLVHLALVLDRCNPGFETLKASQSIVVKDYYAGLSYYLTGVPQFVSLIHPRLIDNMKSPPVTQASNRASCDFTFQPS